MKAVGITYALANFILPVLAGVAGYFTNGDALGPFIGTLVLTLLGGGIVASVAAMIADVTGGKR